MPDSTRQFDSGPMRKFGGWGILDNLARNAGISSLVITQGGALFSVLIHRRSETVKVSVACMVPAFKK